MQVLGINNSENEQVIREFMADFDLTFPGLLDVNSITYAAYRIQGITPYPVDAIIDQNGILRYLQSRYDPQLMLSTIHQLLPTAIDPPANEGAVPSTLEASIFPNPANSSTVVKFRAALNGSGQLKVYDLGGRLLMGRNLSGLLAGAEQEIPLDFDGRASGIYLISLENGSFRKVMKFVLAR